MHRLLNNLCKPADTNYLEVGTYHGSTVVAASYDNPGHFTTVDNWSEFGGPRDSFLKNQEVYKEHCKIVLREDDFRNILLSQFKPGVNVFFYDGAHDAASQQQALEYFAPILADPCLVIVDDWNWPDVRKGTLAAFSSLDWQVDARVELFNTCGRRDTGESYWANGLLLAIVRPSLQAGGAAWDGQGAR